jgi:alcohol dehydrogenase (cytochrome c)
VGQSLGQTSHFKPVTNEMLANPSPDDWLMLGRTYDEQRFSPLNQISKANVKNLQMVWSRGMPEGTQQTIPIVYNGILYVVSPINSVIALDATNGDLVWEYNREAPKGVRISSLAGTSSKSLAIYHDMIYYTSPDGYLVALDAQDGSVHWEV